MMLKENEAQKEKKSDLSPSEEVITGTPNL